MCVKIWLWGLVVFSTLAVIKSAALEYIAYVRSDDGNIYGRVTFTQQGRKVRIHGKIEGLGDGLHGIHVHQLGDISDSCAKTGPDYNPLNKTHGGLMALNRHIGDLGNIRVFDGIGTISIAISENLVPLKAPYRILGRTLVVHKEQDDLGKGTHPDSLTNGHSGKVEACGVIGVVSPTGSIFNGSLALSKLSLKTLVLPILAIIRLNY